MLGGAAILIRKTVIDGGRHNLRRLVAGICKVHRVEAVLKSMTFR
jgi:hypothetical protein